MLDPFTKIMDSTNAITSNITVDTLVRLRNIVLYLHKSTLPQPNMNSEIMNMYHLGRVLAVH